MNHGTSLFLALGLFLLSWVGSAAAQNIWTNSRIKGDWFRAENWSLNQVPTLRESIEVDNGGTPLIRSAEAEVFDIRLGGDRFGSGFIEVKGDSASLRYDGTLYAGDSGNGFLFITCGGAVVANSSILGLSKSGFGSVAVADSGSLWQNAGDIFVGYEGAGELCIEAGATVVGLETYIGTFSNRNNFAHVRGQGSALFVNGDFHVGYAGRGSLVIDAGGLVENEGVGYIGHKLLGDGKVLVTGKGSQWINLDELAIGDQGTGSLRIQAGGSVVAKDTFVGVYDSGELLVTGRKSNLTADNLYVGFATKGEATVKNGGSIHAPGFVFLGPTETGNGMLNIGEGGSPGVIDSPAVTGGPGKAVLNFNHTASNYFLTNNAKASGTAVVLDGELGVNHLGAGKTTLTGTNNYSGGTRISAGTVATRNPSALGTGMLEIAGGTLAPQGTLTLGKLDWKSGRIQLLNPGLKGDHLEITRSFTNEEGGVFEFGALDLNQTYTLATYGKTDAQANDFRVESSNPNVAYVGEFTVGRRQLNFALEGANASGPILQNKQPTGIPTYANFIVRGFVVGSNEKNHIGSLVFEPDAFLNIGEQTLAVETGKIRSEGNSVIAGGKLVTEAGFDFVTKEGTLEMIGELAGRGGLLKRGQGSLVLQNETGYTGATRVREGALFLSQSAIKGDLSVRPSALIGGEGKIDGNLRLEGELDSSEMPGDLEVKGNFTLESSGRLVVNIASAKNYDVLSVGKTARFKGGLLSVDLVGGFKPKVGDEFTFLLADKVNGALGAFEQPEGGQFDLAIDGGNLILIWSSALGDYRNSAANQNQLNVATALQQLRDADLGEDTEFDNNVRPALDELSASGLQSAFEAVMPSQSLAFSETLFARSRSWLPQMATRLADIRAGSRGFVATGMNERGAADMEDVMAPTASNKWGVWVDGAGVFNQVASFANLGRGDGSTAAGTVGVDYRISEALTVGLYAGYLGSWTDFNGGSKVDSNGARFGLYSTYQMGAFYLNGLVGGELNSYDWERRIVFPGINRTASSDPDGQAFETMFGGGYDWQVAQNFSVGAFSALEYSLISVDGFTESGAGALNLKIGDQNAESLRSNVGAQAVWRLEVGGRTLRPSVRAAWRHEFLDGNRTVNSTLNGGAGPSFSTLLPGGDRADSLLLNGGFSLEVTDNALGYLYYTGDLAGGTTDNIHAINAGIRLEF